MFKLLANFFQVKTQPKIAKYVLELIVFLSGAVVMTFELVGSRLLSPYFGNSIFIWTSLIGIIMAGLSLGYYLGGKLADKQPKIKYLSMIIGLAASSIIVTVLIKNYWLPWLQEQIPDTNLAAILACLSLFLPTSILLGMVSPYAVKLSLKDIHKSAATVGNLSALSTAGSIVGTFLSGFYLIPHFGTNNLLIILGLALVFIAGLPFFQSLGKIFGWAVLIILLGQLTIYQLKPLLTNKIDVIDIDTTYNRIWITDFTDPQTSRVMRILKMNIDSHSLAYLNSDELIAEYTKYYHLFIHFKPNSKQVLMLGGGGFSFPKNFLNRYPNLTLDVVEIDPMVTQIAKKYFGLKDNPRLKIITADGRIYLNQSKKTYDAILGDAFTSNHSLPYQLTTLEAIRAEYRILNDQGVAIVNIISALEGENAKFLMAEYATYKQVFPQVYLFPVYYPDAVNKVQNVMLIALKSNLKPNFTSSDVITNDQLSHLLVKPAETTLPILTDDFAPVESYASK